MSAVGVWNVSNAAGGPSWVTPTVSLSSANVSHNTDFTTCYATLRYDNLGEEWENPNGISSGYTASRGDWVDSGDAGGAWLEYALNSGTLYTSPGTAGTRLQQDVNRSFRVRDTNNGVSTVSANLDIEMWDAASGGSLLDSVSGLVLTADYYNSCPACCFLPETLILMSDGARKEIGKIRAGERIAVQGASEEVGEIIVRENRPMAKLTFEDGRTLVLSVDHPIYAKGKGMACVSSETDYKGMGPAAELKIGDYARTDGKILIKVVGIESYDFRGKVYTLSNSLFFAGGILVY